jgi:uncharacterized membrane protein
MSLQLTSDSFEPDFGQVWAEHVDFGTSRSHKKLLKRDREASEWRSRLAAKQTAEAPLGTGKKRQKKAERAAGEPASAMRGPGAGAAPAAPVAPAAVRPRMATQPKTTVLANKGRWGATLASQLLSGER